jgi:phosphopentomutase
MEHRDYRVHELGIEQPASPQVETFWERWRAYYGDTGLVNPRGDRLLTTLALRALKELRPRLLMVNYQDTDYVHWGNPNFYTRAIAVIDEGIREIYNTVQADEEYRNNTIFVVVPDCGRDNNRFMAVPYQHHFNSRSAREIFAVVAGLGIRDRFRPNFVISRQQEQISVGRTIAELMSFTMPTAEADSLLKVV